MNVTELLNRAKAQGVMIATADGTRVSVPPYWVDVVCGLGSGDAFGGAFCHGLLEGWDLVRTVRYGNAAGAIVANRLMCADDMPTVPEIDEFLADPECHGFQFRRELLDGLFFGHR